MSYSNFDQLTRVTDEVASPDYGYYPDKRPLNLLLNYGIVLLDKPAGRRSGRIPATVSIRAQNPAEA